MEGITEYLAHLQQVLGRLPLNDVQRVVESLLAGHEAGAKIFIMGNGGSATTASHFACDLAKGTITSGVPRFRVIALTDNVPLLTAWANDMSYGDIFVEQLHGLLDAGDVVIAISGSGNSENVVRAVRMAKWRGAKTISLTGCGGGKLASLTDVSVVVPSSYMEQIEDVHLILEHLICTVLRQELRKRARLGGGQWREIKVEHRMRGEGRLPFDKAQDKPLPARDESAEALTVNGSTAPPSPSTEFTMSEDFGEIGRTTEPIRRSAQAECSPKFGLAEVWTMLSEKSAPRWKSKLKGVPKE